MSVDIEILGIGVVFIITSIGGGIFSIRRNIRQTPIYVQLLVWACLILAFATSIKYIIESYNMP
jgi:predicted MFS family arabinose efflux permease